MTTPITPEQVARWERLKYSICSTADQRVTTGAVIAEYGRIGKPVPEYLARLIRDGERYSYESFDIMSACMNEFRKLDHDVWNRISEPRVA